MISLASQIRQWEDDISTRRLRVLVVDDNPHDRRLVVRELRKAYDGVEILEAINQSQLDDHISAMNYDVVVTDYHLKWSDGIRVLQAVKRCAPNCPVIMFTGTGSEEIAVEAMKLGLDDYIIKNVKHLIRLRSAVHSAVEHALTRARANRLASRLASLLSQLQVGVFSCDRNGGFVDMNDAMVRLLGCRLPADAYQQSLQSMISDADLADRFLGQLLASDEAQELEFDAPSLEAGPRNYRLTARRAASDDIQEETIDGLLEDITKRKQSEVQLQRSIVATAQLSMLSPRETDVFKQVVSGLPNKVIARRLEISEKTVEKHRSSLMKKLDLRSVAELVRLAMEAESADS